MKKRLFALIVIVLALSMMTTSASYAAGKENFGTKVKNFWRNLIGYPARVTEESASVVADTGKKGVSVVTNEVKRIGDVTTGDFAKTKELVTEPITGTAETAVTAVEGTVKVPSEALKEKPAQATQAENK
ncbi:MAG: hypothetical protein HZA72_04065 [Candidatus Omnitrophica bacterium]|nr:hypothetical protein [Candidatus Omnitrophota bacterium]